MITETINKTKQDAQRAFLDNQRRGIIERLEATGKGERAATVRHIDGLIRANLSPRQNEFWKSVKTDIIAIDADNPPEQPADDPVYFNDGELDRDFVGLVRNFDARSAKGKRTMISMFDVLEARMLKENDEVLIDEVREVVGNMKRFFEQRLKSSKTDGGE
jgi:hypothetical protein